MFIQLTYSSYQITANYTLTSSSSASFKIKAPIADINDVIDFKRQCICPKKSDKQLLTDKKTYLSLQVTWHTKAQHCSCFGRQHYRNKPGKFNTFFFFFKLYAVHEESNVILMDTFHKPWLNPNIQSLSIIECEMEKKI